MKMALVLILCIAFAAVSDASIIPTVEVLQGPGSRTTLLGPDGSALDAAAPGGTLVTNSHGTGLVAAGPAILPAAGAPVIVNGPAGSIATTYTLAGPAIVPGIAAAAAQQIPTAVLTGPALGPAIGSVHGAALAGSSVYAAGQGAYLG